MIFSRPKAYLFDRAAAAALALVTMHELLVRARAIKQASAGQYPGPVQHCELAEPNFHLRKFKRGLRASFFFCGDSLTWQFDR
jgi:hypothetical protein